MLRGDRHQLWDCRDVPVGVGDLSVPDVGIQSEQVAIDIDTLFAPAPKSPTHERVTIMPRAA